MSSWSEGQRPLTLAILALGGEGGGVLADWIVAVAEAAGCPAQNTSVAGVAQRTGATVYYVEIFPAPLVAESAGARVRSEPVMSIFPTPGEVDVVITSELMESGRAIQRGFATPDRTTLITSTNRVYSIDEKMAMGDGRVDDSELLAAAKRSSRRLIAADFSQLAQESGSVISASLFGAVAGSEALPFTREQFEDAIRASGKSVEPSLAAFSAGFDAASLPPAAAPSSTAPATDPLSITHWSSSKVHGNVASPTPEDQKQREEDKRNLAAAADPTALVGPDLRHLALRTAALPDGSRSMILHGLVRTAVYQDRAYAERFLERVARFAQFEPDPDGAAALTREAARHIGLWMCYQDTIYVALQKTRRARLQRVRSEAKAKPDQRLDVHEFLHPQIDEITDTLPAALGAALRRSKSFERIVHRLTHKGMILNTTSIAGYTLLTTMARCRPLRPRSLRFQREQRAIDAWIATALAVAASGDTRLALEIVNCQAVLKGYGETWARGWASFQKLMAAAEQLQGVEDAAVQLAELRAAALADEAGSTLDSKLGESALA